MSDAPSEIVNSRCVEFPGGSVSIYANGTSRFHFRHMDYVYKAGVDSEDGMAINLSPDVTKAIKALFEREGWP